MLSSMVLALEGLAVIGNGQHIRLWPLGVGAGLGEFFPGDADGEIVGAGEAESRGEVDGLRRGDGEEGRGDEGDSGEGERTREGHEGRDQGRFEPLIFANFSERRPSPYRLRPRLGGIG